MARQEGRGKGLPDGDQLIAFALHQTPWMYVELEPSFLMRKLRPGVSQNKLGAALIPSTVPGPHVPSYHLPLSDFQSTAQ